MKTTTLAGSRSLAGRGFRAGVWLVGVLGLFLGDLGRPLAAAEAGPGGSSVCPLSDRVCLRLMLGGGLYSGELDLGNDEWNDNQPVRQQVSGATVLYSLDLLLVNRTLWSFYWGLWGMALPVPHIEDESCPIGGCWEWTQTTTVTGPGLELRLPALGDLALRFAAGVNLGIWYAAAGWSAALAREWDIGRATSLGLALQAAGWIDSSSCNDVGGHGLVFGGRSVSLRGYSLGLMMSLTQPFSL
jgi:hypothetical protein